MSFRDCLLSAQQQGILSDEEVERLLDRYQEHLDARRAAGGDFEGNAKTALAAELAEAGARKKALAALAEGKRDEIKAYLESYRNAKGEPDVYAAAANLLENHGYGAGTSSVANRSKAKFDLAAGELADLLSKFRRSRITGGRFNKPQAENVVREILGENTGNAEAKGMAEATSGVFEKLRNEFNAAGGAIDKLENYLPQNHSPIAVLRAGFKSWRDYIVPKLDTDRMKDPLTGGALTPERLDETLKSAWGNIVGGGWATREPGTQKIGAGALANQRNEHRFLHFKDADSWLAYNRDFGQGDPMAAIFQHIKGMTRDTASMELLGPNPNATVEWLKQVVASEADKHLRDEPTLYNGGAKAHVQDAISYDGRKIEALWDAVRGREVASKRIATGFGNLRNILTSAQLGGASILAAIQDPFIDMAARHLSGLPMARAMAGITKTFSTWTREQAVRAGLGLDDFLHVMGEEARYAGTLGGSEWSRWLADRTVNLNGLEPITQARKHLFGLEFTGQMADHAGLSWDELGRANPPLQRTMTDYGLGSKDWDKLRVIDPHIPSEGSAPLLRPTDVAVKNKPLAERYLEMILGQTERAVPTGTARSRILANVGTTAGTAPGEIAASFLQYKSFTLSFMALQWQAMMMEARGGSAAGVAASALPLVARGAAYAGGLAISMTFAGAAAMQLQNIVAGRDMQDMTTPKFWMAALQKGGGFGIMGDFLFSDTSRFGSSPIETLLGPQISFVADIAKVGIGNMQKVLSSDFKHIHAARDATNLMGRYTPMLSSLPYTRMAYRRMVLDQLQFLGDPDAHKHFREQERQLRTDTGQSYYWKPGEAAPSRAPVMAPPKVEHSR